MNIFGRNVKFSVSGEKNGPILLITLDGIPAGEAIDTEEAGKAALRHVPGALELGNDQQPFDTPVVVCGLKGGITDGTPFTAMIRVREELPRLVNAPRPGHEDLAVLQGLGISDFSAGAYSGRINYAVAFAGAFCSQILMRQNIEISARVTAIGAACGEDLDFEMKKELLDARGNGDSVGSVVECVVAGLPAGLGSPAFDGVESRIAALLFSVPGVKGVEFGLGFGFAAMRGSVANDQITLSGGRISAETNNSGGVDMGITTGRPLVVRAALRPTPAIGREQRSVNVDTMSEITMRLRGRNEPCLGPRAVPVVEGAVALCLLDAVLENNKKREYK
ncbi:MAG: chorismate synthase [Clostridia bacterium]|nr:chorismate synthase [Clostridia bacterium]